MVTEAQELRIGNWVNDPTRGGIIQVDAAEMPSYYFACGPDGISISEQWLRRYGFKGNHRGEQTLQIDNGFEISFIKGVIFLGMASEYHVGYELKHIRYIHQLQNLFFSITGREMSESDSIA